jgi:hypothetical protein
VNRVQWSWFRGGGDAAWSAPVDRFVDAFAGMRESFERAGRAFERVSAALLRAKEVRVSGLEARYYVRGAFCSLAELDALVQRLMRRRETAVEWGFFPCSEGDRARLAAAAMRGWVEAR